jgi:AcrR family transcriptional regulator
LNAAERLFIRSGYHGISVRDIADEAGVNSGSVYYYCKSKDDLIQIMISRRIGSINTERIRRLKAIEIAPPRGKRSALFATLEAFIEPLLLFPSDTPIETARLIRAVHSRIHHDAASEVAQIVDAIFDEVSKLFVHLVRRFATHLTEDECSVRLLAVMGTITFVNAPNMERAPDADVPLQITDFAEASRQLIAMLHAGLMAPSLQE